MKILIIRGAFGEVYEPSWVRALLELGNDVSLFDSHAFLSPGFLGRLERRFLLGFGISRVRKESIKFALAMKPDLILLYQGHYHDRISIIRLKTIAWVTGYHNDNIFAALDDGRHKVRYRHLLKALPYYSSFHVYRESNIEDLRNCGVTHVGLLRSYYIPWLDTPFLYQKSVGFHCDVVFAGHPEPDGREKYLIALLENGIDLKIYGDPIRWKRLIPRRYHHQIADVRVLNPKDYRQALISANICLAFFSKWNRDDYTRRVFEIPAMKKFLMAERTDLMTLMYNEDTEAVYFCEIDEFVHKIKYYLNNPEMRKKIEVNGYNRCIKSGYDIFTVMNKFVSDLNSWKKLELE